jgi:Uma2 family endonuclease
LAISARHVRRDVMGRRTGNLSVYEQRLEVPDNLVAEIIHGALVTQPRPAARHARAATRLGGALGPFDLGGAEAPGGWIILVEPELHLGPDILVPDLAGWQRSRMAELPDVAAFELAPDWICEVVSPSTAAVDRTDKMPIYGEAGVGHAWLVDPLAQTLEVFRRDGGLWVLLDGFKDDARVRAEPFDAIELDLAALWAR